MNGYVTATASLSRKGHKSTLAAACPRAALFDLEVLAQAPVRLIRAGIGDVLCRTTAQTDWLLAHLLLGTPYDELPFLWQADDEPAAAREGAAMVAGEAGAILALTRLLVLSGLGMVEAGSSAPGSQAEHLVSHYLDMMDHDHQPRTPARRAGRRRDALDQPPAAPGPGGRQAAGRAPDPRSTSRRSAAPFRADPRPPVPRRAPGQGARRGRRHAPSTRGSPRTGRRSPRACGRSCCRPPISSRR